MFFRTTFVAIQQSKLVVNPTSDTWIRRLIAFEPLLIMFWARVALMRAYPVTENPEKATIVSRSNRTIDDPGVVSKFLLHRVDEKMLLRM